MKNIKNLTKEELLEIISEYSNYVTEYCESNDIQPVCFNEFYQNDYQEIPHKKEKYMLDISACDDTDFIDWLDKNGYYKNTVFEITNVDYYGTFNVWFENCPFAINPDILIKFNNN